MKNIRITGGILKGKNIPFEFKNTLRPTSSKLREILFNWLQFEISNLRSLFIISINISQGRDGVCKICVLDQTNNNSMSMI